MLTSDELRVVWYLLAIGLTTGAVLVVIVIAGLWAVSGLADDRQADDPGFDDLQKELDAWREGPTDVSTAPTRPTKPVPPTLREIGWYDGETHQARTRRIARAIRRGGSDAA